MPVGSDGTPRTTFKELLEELRDALAKNLALAPEKIFLSIKKLGDLTNIKSTQFVILRPGSGIVDGQWTDSEGRLCTVIDRTLIVEPYLQQSLDEVTESNRITPTFLDFESQIIDVLQIYEPRLTLEPLHFLGVEAEDGWQTPGWAHTSLRFSVKFLQSVDQARQ